MGTYPLYFISPLFSQLFPVFLSKSQRHRRGIETQIEHHIDPNFYVAFNRNFYTAELRSETRTREFNFNMPERE
jgi:hypothetical protein